MQTFLFRVLYYNLDFHVLVVFEFFISLNVLWVLSFLSLVLSVDDDMLLFLWI